MSKCFKSLKKSAEKNTKKFMQRLNSDSGLTLKRTFNTTTAFYSNGRQNKPYVTITSEGNYKISVLKLILIIIAVSTFISVAMLILKALVEKLTEKKKLGKYKSDAKYIYDDDYYDDDEGLPF